MTRTPSRFTRLLTIAALILGAGCNGDDNKIPGDQKANPVAPTFLFLDVRASRTTTTAGDLTHPVLITVQANFADTGAPVANGTKINLSTTLGSFDAPGGAATLVLEVSGGLGTLNYFPPATGAGGTARIRAELQGLADSTQITVKPAPGERPVPEPAPVASTITLQADPTAASEEVASTDILLTAIVRNNEGNPHKNGPVNFTTTVGSLASGGAVLASDEDGAVSDTLTVTGVELEALTASSFQVGAVLGVVGGTATSTFDVTILRADAPPTPVSVVLSAAPTSVADDGSGEAVALSAVVRDQFGALMSGVDVQFNPALGTATPTSDTTDGTGTATSTLNLTAGEISGHPSTTFDVDAVIGVLNGTATDTVTITIARDENPPVPTSIILTVAPTSVADDGAGKAVDLDAVVRDQFGAVMAGVDVQFTTTLGSLSFATDATDGGGVASSTVNLTAGEIAAHPSNSFTVEAIIGVSGGTQIDSSTITISRAGLAALFAASANPIIAVDTVVEFTDLSTGGPTSWAWDLDGDGFADDAAIPSPIFDYAGYPACTTIQVTLIVSNLGGSDSASTTLTVEPCP